jgi:hypothetical protein
MLILIENIEICNISLFVSSQPCFQIWSYVEQAFS